MNAADALAALAWEDSDVDVMHFECLPGGAIAVSVSGKGSDYVIGVWLTDGTDGIHADIRGATAGGEPIRLQASVLDADATITVFKVDTP